MVKPEKGQEQKKKTEKSVSESDLWTKEEHPSNGDRKAKREREREREKGRGNTTLRPRAFFLTKHHSFEFDLDSWETKTNKRNTTTVSSSPNKETSA